MGAVVAGELGCTVDDHLRGVGAFEVEALGVLGLALGEVVGGEAVVPALAVPVVDVLAEDDDFCGGDWLILEEMGEEGVGGRATGAALGGKELD